MTAITKITLLLQLLYSNASDSFTPYGFQSGHFTNPSSSSSDPSTIAADAESIDDDSFAGGMYYDAQRNLLYFTGMTYSVYFDGDHAKDETDGDASGGLKTPHLANSDCFLGVLKLPQEEGPNLKEDPSWLIHSGTGGDAGAKLIYARR